MSALDNLLDSVKQSIVDHVQQGGHQNFDTGGLLSKITDLFGKHQQNADRNVAPASRDPYGDPADQRGGSGPNPRARIRTAIRRISAASGYGDVAAQLAQLTRRRRSSSASGEPSGGIWQLPTMSMIGAVCNVAIVGKS